MGTVSDFDETAQQVLGETLEALSPLMDRLSWTRSELDAHRSRALGEILSHAVERSSWHARRLRSLDLGPITPYDLSVLPTMSKAEVMEHWDQIVTDPELTLERARRHLERIEQDGPCFLDGRYLVFTTGGSTGEPAIFPWSISEFARWAASAMRVGALEGLGPPSRLAHVAARSTRHPSAIAPMLLHGHSAGSDLVIPVDEPIESIVGRLNRVQPDSLWVVCSMLPALTEAASDGTLQIAPDRISVGGDQLEPGALDRAEAVFGVRPTETYPTTDVGYIAHQIPGDPSMLVNDDLMIVEPVDERDRAVPLGELSHHLLVTSLHQRTLPLIRYRIDDRVRFDVKPGRCEAFNHIEAIDGRSDDLFEYPGSVVHPHIFRSALTKHPGLRDYEVHQTERGARVMVSFDGSAEPDVVGLADELTDSLATSGLASPEVHIQVVDCLGRSVVGKRRLFHPLPEQTSAPG